MRRIVLFILTNLAIMLMVTLIARVTGLDAWLAQRGSNFGALLLLAAIFGFGGSFISLAMSKWMAVRSMGVQIIQQPANERERWLIETVRNLATRSGLGMPEVGIFDSPQPNAFATGPKRNDALVAVSSGLLAAMKPDEIEAVLGHEITHVANGDMVTLTLIQGVLNTFVTAIAWIVGNIVDRSVLRNEEGRGIGYMLTVWVTQIVLGVFATLIVLWFSRRREYRADWGGAHLTGREHMIAALERLQRAHEEPLPSHMDAFAIAGRSGGGLGRLLMSHPTIEERIAALRAAPDLS
jgi:heat shock protein HtpX